MTLSQYNSWKADGRPFRLMTPAEDLQTNLQRHGYTVYDIGNESHMLASPAEDHTPFSGTGWPGLAKYGVGYALDVMPPAPGARSKLDGKPLPSLQQLGAQLVKDRKAGVPGISWLKYINWEPERNNGGPCYQESWKPNHARKSSSDRGHIHVSARTGMETSTVARGYDPVARIRQGANDVGILEGEQAKWLEKSAILADWMLNPEFKGFAIREPDGEMGPVQPMVQRLLDLLYVTVAGPSGSGAFIGRFMVEQRLTTEALREALAAVASAGGSVDVAAILAGVDARVAAAVVEIQAETRDAVADLGEGGAQQVRADQA